MILRTIFHVDVNSAFLSWSAVKKLREEPGSVDLRTIPSAVGGDVSTRHGIITAKSIPAKKYGVETGEPVVKALQKCPQLVLVKSDFETYRKMSAAFIEVLRRYSSVIEKVSIDEAYLDMTEAVEEALCGGVSAVKGAELNSIQPLTAPPGMPAVKGAELNSIQPLTAPLGVPAVREPESVPAADNTDFADKREKRRRIALAIAHTLREDVRDTLGFTVNVGISENKLLAKMASDFQKPDKVHTLYPEEVPEKMWPLPIRVLHGCGAATAGRLADAGVKTIGDAAKLDPEYIRMILGNKAGEYIWRSANGISTSPVNPESQAAKSYSNETTTAVDITAGNLETDGLPLVKHLAEKVSGRLKRDRVRAFTIGVQVKTSDFRRHSRQQTLTLSTDDAAVIYETSRRLLTAMLEGEDGLFASGAGIRLLGVGASGLEDCDYRQLDLFGWQKDQASARAEERKIRQEEQNRAARKARQERLDAMLPAVENRYGKDVLTLGSPGRDMRENTENEYD